MKRLLLLTLVACLLLAFPACGSAGEDSGRRLALRESVEQSRLSSPSGDEFASPFGTYYAGFPSPVPSHLAGNHGLGLPEGLGTNPHLHASGHDPMSLAVVGLEVASVAGATLQVQSIAASVGGHVSRLTTIGGAHRSRSEITIRVPQDQLDRAMERILGLGEVQYRSLGSSDVTDPHVNLTARLAALRLEEQGLSSLRERGSSVAELLSVERELARVGFQIERAQWQLKFLERQVELAAIHVILLPRGAVAERVPAATFTLEVNDIPGSVAGVQQFVEARLGEIDEVYLASQGPEEQAEIAFRMYPDDLNRMSRFVESQGNVTARKLLDLPSSVADGGQAREPRARIHVTYVHRQASLNAWSILLIILGILIMAGIIAYLMRMSYSRGRRRGSFI